MTSASPRRNPRRRGAALLLGIAALAGCAEDPSYRPGRRLSLLALFDRLDLASSPWEPVQLRLVRCNGVERASIAAHAPSRVRLPALRVPPAARLSFGVGLDDGALNRLSDGVRFAVLVEEGAAAAREIWSMAADPVRRVEDRGWKDVEVDLGPWAGRTVGLILAAEPQGNPAGDRAAWSHPTIRSRGEPPPADLPPVRRTTIERDLLDAGGERSTFDRARGRTPGDVRACVQRLQIAVPAGGGLDIAGQVLRDDAGAPGPLGPLRLAVSVDDHPILSRELTSNEAILTVAESVSLAEYSGRTVDLSFELCDVGPGNALVWGKRLWLTRTEEIARQPLAADPNLLVLLVDTLRADHLGTYGHDLPTSPRLDRLSREALVFEQAISPSSWTLPAVASVLTGRTPLEHGVIEGVPFPPDAPTLAERLQAEGLTTYGFSSNPIVGRLEAAQRGFETFVQVPWARADEVNRVFLDWLDEHRAMRWFAYLHYVDPHSPYDAPAPEGERFNAGCTTRFAEAGALHALSEAINIGRGEMPYEPGDIDCLRARYDGEIRFWDAQLGALLDALEHSGTLENTVVIVTSDHGEEFMEHGHLLHGYQLYEESIRVPLVIWGPGHVVPGRSAEPVETRSLFATALDLMGAAAPDAVAPSLLGDAESPAAVFSHTTEAFVQPTGYTVLASARDARWKYILRPADGAAELFDLEHDPHERADVGAAESAIRERWDTLLRGWLSGARPGAPQTRGLDLNTLERLRALGYIR